MSEYIELSKLGKYNHKRTTSRGPSCTRIINNNPLNQFQSFDFVSFNTKNSAEGTNNEEKWVVFWIFLSVNKCNFGR